MEDNPSETEFEARYHTELIRKFFNATSMGMMSMDHDAIDEVAEEVSKMSHGEVVVFTTQVVVCTKEGPLKFLRSGILTGALYKQEGLPTDSSMMSGSGNQFTAGVRKIVLD